jgi:hypothetical protein
MSRKYSIRNRFDDRILFAGVFESPADLLKAAVAAKVDLRTCSFPFAFDFSCAELSGVDFSYADLFSVRFDGANLDRACFRRADLRMASFAGCDLRDTVLEGADLRHTNLCGAQLDPVFAASLSVVSEGDVIGWKKCHNGVVVKLLIPAAARRSNGTGRKCRAEYVKVLALFPEVSAAFSLHDGTRYEVGKTVRCVPRFDEDRWNECSAGIHFFLTEEEARAF